MNIAELQDILVRHTVPPHYYVFGGLGQGECYGIEHTSGGWLIYYSERGQKTPLDSFSNEDQACRKFLTYVAEMTGDASLAVD